MMSIPMISGPLRSSIRDLNGEVGVVDERVINHHKTTRSVKLL